jgi:hypothetical protein
MVCSWKLKTHILFCGDNSQTAALKQTKFGTMKDHGHAYKFYMNHYFFDAAFEYGSGLKS